MYLPVTLLRCRLFGSTQILSRIPLVMGGRMMCAATVVAAISVACAPLCAQEASSVEQTVFSNENPGGVSSDPPVPTVFALQKPTIITFVRTYHWNGGKGSPAGSVELLDERGVSLGKWPATLHNRVYWVAKPHIKLVAGNYTIRDTNPTTWSWNEASARAGFATVNGMEAGSAVVTGEGGSRPVGGAEPPPAKGAATASFPEMKDFDSLTAEQRASRLRAGETKPNGLYWELVKIETMSEELKRTWPEFLDAFSGQLSQANGYILDESNEDWNDEAGQAKRTVHRRIVRYAFTPCGYLIPGKTVSFAADLAFDMGGTVRSIDLTGMPTAGASAVIGGKDVFSEADGTARMRRGRGTLRLTGVSEPMPTGSEGDETVIELSVIGGLGGGWVRYTYRYRTH